MCSKYENSVALIRGVENMFSKRKRKRGYMQRRGARWHRHYAINQQIAGSNESVSFRGRRLCFGVFNLHWKVSASSGVR